MEPEQPRPPQSEVLEQPEREKLKRLLGFPSDYPKPFASWIPEFIAVFGLDISVQQLRGWAKVTPYAAVEASTGVRAASAYADLVTPGPTLSDLPSGEYILVYGANLFGNFFNSQGAMAPAYNGVTPPNDNEAAVGYSIPDAFRAITKRLDAPSNEIKMKYRWVGGVDSSIAFQRRWLVALRIGN